MARLANMAKRVGGRIKKVVKDSYTVAKRIGSKVAKYAPKAFDVAKRFADAASHSSNSTFKSLGSAVGKGAAAAQSAYNKGVNTVNEGKRIVNKALGN